MDRPLLSATADSTHVFIATPSQTRTVLVHSVTDRSSKRAGYAMRTPSDLTYVVEGERAIPAERRRLSRAERGVLRSRLRHGPRSASYLVRPDHDQRADRPAAPGGLPLQVQVPFGNSTLTLIAAARGDLGVSMGGDLARVFLVSGPVPPVEIPVTVAQLVTRCRTGEADANTIAVLD